MFLTLFLATTILTPTVDPLPIHPKADALIHSALVAETAHINAKFMAGAALKNSMAAHGWTAHGAVKMKMRFNWPTALRGPSEGLRLTQLGLASVFADEPPHFSALALAIKAYALHTDVFTVVTDAGNFGLVVQDATGFIAALRAQGVPENAKLPEFSAMPMPWIF